MTLQYNFGQSLDDYLKISETSNPEIEYFNLNHNIYIEKVNETGNLDNTNFSLGYYIFPPETKLGAQTLKLGAQQSLPWPGTFKARKQVAKSIANEKKYDTEIAKRDLFLNIKMKYYNLYFLAAILNVLGEYKGILNIYANMALGGLENNKTRMSNVLKIRIQKNELHSKIFSNFNTSFALSKQFNRLLNRNEDEILSIPDSLSVLDIGFFADTTISHPELQKFNANQLVFHSEKEQLKTEEKLRFSVSLDYINVSKRKDQLPINNGRDILIPMVGISVPIFNKKYDAKSRRLDLSIKKAKLEKYNRKQVFKSQLDLAQSNLKNSILQVVAAQKNKEEIQRAIDSDLKAYETGTLDYDNILRMQLQKLKYQLMEVQGTKDAFKQKAIIEFLVGK